MIEHQDKWNEYKSTGSLAARDWLIEKYLPLVSFVAAKIKVTLPNNVEHDDLASYGTFGLVDAIEKFDLALGFKFETYAITRIRGSIIDELRLMDWVPRSVRSRQRAVSKAADKLEAELNRKATDAELAVELEMTIEDVASIRAQTSRTYIGYYDEESPDHEDSFRDTIPDDSVNISNDSAMRDVIERIRADLALGAELSPERERMVLALYYNEGLTLSEVGQVLGVTESRICQIHTKAVSQLRDMITPSDLEPS